MVRVAVGQPPAVVVSGAIEGIVDGVEAGVVDGAILSRSRRRCGTWCWCGTEPWFDVRYLKFAAVDVDAATLQFSSGV